MMSSNQLLSYALVFILAFGLAVVLTVIARRIGPRLGLVDVPRGRHQQPGPVAKFGTLPLWGSFTIVALVAQRLPIERGDPYEVIRLSGLLLGGTFIFLFGLIDDRWERGAISQFIAQLITAAIGVGFLIFIERVNNPITGTTIEGWPYLVTVIISLFWLGLMMNTVNWLDGVDGLAGGVVLIASILLFIHTVREGELSVSLLPLALMGTLVGFLIFNWHPASIFMGSGAIFLGYTIGALSIIGGAKMATILMVMGLPLLDVAWQVARRLARGKVPLIGDRGHLHFRLIDIGLSHRQISIVYYLLCAAFGLLALITTSRQFKLLALMAMILTILAGFAIVARYPRRVESLPRAGPSPEASTKQKQNL